MKIRDAIKDNNIRFNRSGETSCKITFNKDETLDICAKSAKDLEEKWKKICEIIEVDIDSVVSIDYLWREYRARVAFNGVWCEGTTRTYGSSIKDAHDAAMDEIKKDLHRMFPGLKGIEISVEIIELAERD